MLSKFPRIADVSEVSRWESVALDDGGGNRGNSWSIFPYFCADWRFRLLDDGWMTYLHLHVNARGERCQRILTFLSESQFEEGGGLELVRQTVVGRR